MRPSSAGARGLIRRLAPGAASVGGNACACGLVVCGLYAPGPTCSSVPPSPIPIVPLRPADFRVIDAYRRSEFFIAVVIPLFGPVTWPSYIGVAEYDGLVRDGDGRSDL